MTTSHGAHIASGHAANQDLGLWDKLNPAATIKEDLHMEAY
jgi:hypothetical protein